MRTEINKKRGRPFEHREEARAKGAKRGKNNWRIEGDAVSPPNGFKGIWDGAPEKLAFLRFIIVKKAISLREMQDIPDR